MSFTIEGGVKKVYACNDCGWCQIEKHFGEEQTCLMCGGDGRKVEEIQPSTGMSNFKYRELLERLEEDAAGVGAATVANIEQHFEEGDNFRDAAEAGYREMEFDDLIAVDGVGQASAKEIALTIADEEGWENGAIFQF
jgi:hypothetical protein